MAQFIIEVEVELREGWFVSNDEIAQAIEEEIMLDTFYVDESEYVVNDVNVYPASAKAKA